MIFFLFSEPDKFVIDNEPKYITYHLCFWLSYSKWQNKWFYYSFFSWKIFSIEIAHWRIKQTKKVQFPYRNGNETFNLVCTYSLLHIFQVCFSGLQVLGSTPETTRSSICFYSTLTFRWCENRKPNATTHQDCCLLFNKREKSCL